MGVSVAVAEHSGLGFEEVNEEYAGFDDLPISVVLVGVAVLHADLSVAVPAGTGWAESELVGGEVAARPQSLVVASVGPLEAQGRNAALVSNRHAAQVAVEQIGTVAKYVACVNMLARVRWCWTCSGALPEAAVLASAADSALWHSFGGTKVFDGGLFAVAYRPTARLTAVISSAVAGSTVTRAC